jgi:hypothetical protein
MKGKTGWILATIFGLIILLSLAFLVGGRLWMFSQFDRLGPGMMYNHYRVFPFLFFGRALMWLVPAGVLVLVVIGIVALVNALQRPAAPVPPPAPARVCANCGKPAQADWITCPYCGTAL